MSNNELQRKYTEKVEFFISENITVFAETEKEIIDIIEKHFKSEALEQSDLNETKQRLIYTHRSPNRNFKNYRTLERGMIEAKQSPEIHFVRQKNIRTIRKFLSEITSLFFDIRKQITFEKKYSQVYTENMGDEHEGILDS